MADQYESDMGKGPSYVAQGNNAIITAEPVEQVVQPGGRRPRPPAGKWVDGICSWYTNLYPSCFCATCICHGCWLTAQLSEKTRCYGGGLSKMIIGVYSVIFFVVTLLELTHDLGGHSGWIPWIFLIIVGIPLRLHVIQAYKITEFEFWETHGSASPVGEALLALFCSPCSLAQIARHVYGYDPERLFDGDARFDRDDNWESNDSTGLLDPASNV